MSLDNQILKNISSLFSINIAGYLIPLVTLPYLVRTLGPAGYGELVFSLAIIQYFIILVNYGFDLSATQKIAKNIKDKSVVSSIFWNVLLVRLIISVLGAVILYLLSILNKEINQLLFILISGYLGVFAAALSPQFIFQGKEKLSLISTIRIIISVINIPLIFIFIDAPNDIWLVALFFSLSSILIVFVSVFLIIKHKWVFWVSPSIYSVSVEFKDGWHLFMSTIGISMYTTSVPVILGVISGPVNVAIYVSANKLLRAAQTLYAPLSIAFYPRINNIMNKNTNEGLNTIKYLMKIQFILTLFISISLYISAPNVINLLYGSEYRESIIVLQVLSILPVVIGLSNIFGVQTLLVYGYKKELSRILLFSGLLSLLTLLPLSFLYSAVGAAFSVVITETIVTLLMLRVVLRKKIRLFKS